MSVLMWLLTALSLLAAVAYLALKASVAYDTQGGSQGMVPVLDGVLVPPALVAMGAELGWGRSHPAAWFVGGLSAFAVCSLALALATRLGRGRGASPG